MTNIEYQGEKSKWMLGSIDPKQMYESIPKFRIPVMRYRKVTIWRSLFEWTVIHTRWENVNGIDRKLVYVMGSPDLKGLKQMVDVLMDPQLNQQMAKVLTNHVDRSHLENCLKANETIMNTERQVGLLEIKFNEVNDENTR